jgi:GMP synthase-like glutamine amidotransferase
MSGSVLVVLNVPREGTGTFGEVLADRGIRRFEVDLAAGAPIPDPAEFGAMLVMGGPASANDDTPAMRREIAAVKRALGAGVPTLGVCLGLQALVKAAGGRVVPSPVREVGWNDPAGVPFTLFAEPAVAGDPVFAGVPFPLPVFQLHGETVEPAESAVLLAFGTSCRHQIVRVADRAWGIQGHLELTRPLLDRWMFEDPDLVALPDGALVAGWDAHGQALRTAAEDVFGRFLDVAGLH